MFRPQARREIHVIQHWAEELTERVPVNQPMPLEPGTTLGPYQVTAKIGEGGMGEVYEDTDTRLDRTGAIKALPKE